MNILKFALALNFLGFSGPSDLYQDKELKISSKVIRESYPAYEFERSFFYKKKDGLPQFEVALKPENGFGWALGVISDRPMVRITQVLVEQKGTPMETVRIINRMEMIKDGYVGGDWFLTKEDRPGPYAIKVYYGEDLLFYVNFTVVETKGGSDVEQKKKRGTEEKEKGKPLSSHDG